MKRAFSNINFKFAKADNWYKVEEKALLNIDFESARVDRWEEE